MSQVTVYTGNVGNSVQSQTAITDKLQISTTNSEVIYQVYATALGNAAAVGNIYSNRPILPPNSQHDIYVGVGNQFWLSAVGNVVGGNFTAIAIGTASSAQAGVIGQGNG